MPFLSTLERLTWRNQGPAPFESASNVFFKVMSLNSLTFGELRALIQREEEKMHDFPWALTHGNWVNFFRYSSLLRVDQARLKEGFLDWLGFDSPNGGAIGFRHCTECLGLNYHCTLFNLAIVTECPWHRCPLGKGCYACAARLQTKGTPRCATDVPCSCGSDWSYLFEWPDVNLVPTALANQINSYCRRFVGWWAYVRQNSHSAFPLLAPIIETFSTQYQLNEQRDMAFYFADKIAPFPSPWRHSITPTAARIVRLNRPEQVEFTRASKKQRMQELRSVRRYIFKRFVKPHRRCLRTLLIMNEAERRPRDSSLFCSVCIAYVSWLGPQAQMRETWSQATSDEANAEQAVFERLVRTRSDDWGRFAEQALLGFLTTWASIEHFVSCSSSSLHNYVDVTFRVRVNRRWTADRQHVFFEGASGCETSSVGFLLMDEVELENRARCRCGTREPK